jgi:hypothetical protein
MAKKDKKVFNVGPGSKPKDDIGAVVDRAIERMAGEVIGEGKVLALKPGLHVRRCKAFPDGQSVYTVVRVIGCNRGDGMEYKIFTLNHLDGQEELELTQFEIESSYFMEIKE